MAVNKGKKRVISHYDFVRDMDRGAIGESVVECFLEKEFGLVAANVSERNPDYDLLIKELTPALKKGKKVVPKRLLKKIIKDTFGYSRKEEITIEVKFDEAAARHRNFFIEVFFDIDTGSPGTTFKCKADIIAWVVPRRKYFKVYLFKRPEFLAWFMNYVFTKKKKVVYKTPGISPQARGIPIPIKEAVDSCACVGEYEYKL